MPQCVREQAAPTRVQHCHDGGVELEWQIREQQTKRLETASRSGDADEVCRSSAGTAVTRIADGEVV
jgi:hypothetical protein